MKVEGIIHMNYNCSCNEKPLLDVVSRLIILLQHLQIKFQQTEIALWTLQVASLDEVCKAIGHHLIRKLYERTKLSKDFSRRNCQCESEEFNQRNLKELQVDQKYNEDHKEDCWSITICEVAKNLTDNQDLDVETWHEKK
ncbi:hypothetical protein Glove_230g10 [Diversispora epigaea]|uniref:Uncharacterized protein n=1 Tax=Diversispora epigaea TaxID=1348612 RepID=A0A397ILQ1_9GLOM|nr:hypothetical protein Glove_230g10 [Diversispora epigaea]